MKLDNAFFAWRCLLAMLALTISFNPSFSQVWSPLGMGTNGNINAVFVYNNELIAGGNNLQLRADRLLIMLLNGPAQAGSPLA